MKIKNVFRQSMIAALYLSVVTFGTQSWAGNVTQEVIASDMKTCSQKQGTQNSKNNDPSDMNHQMDHSVMQSMMNLSQKVQGSFELEKQVQAKKKQDFYESIRQYDEEWVHTNNG